MSNVRLTLDFDTKEARNEVNRFESELKSAFKTGEVSLRDLRNAQKQLAQALDDTFDQELRADIGRVNTEIEKTRSAMLGTADSASGAFGTMRSGISETALLLNGYTAAFAGVGAVIATTANAAIEAERANMLMVSSIEAANREFGTAVGSADFWQQSLARLSEQFQIYAKSDLEGAIGKTVDMTKRLGLSGEQMEVVIERAANLAAGKMELGDAVERVTAALRGEAESAEVLGLTLSESYVMSNLRSVGIEREWKNLTELERAQARYQFLLAQTNELTNRAAEYANIAAGRLQILRNKWDEGKASLGNYFLTLANNIGILDAMVGRFDRLNAAITGNWLQLMNLIYAEQQHAQTQRNNAALRLLMTTHSNTGSAPPPTPAPVQQTPKMPPMPKFSGGGSGGGATKIPQKTPEQMAAEKILDIVQRTEQALTNLKNKQKLPELALGDKQFVDAQINALKNGIGQLVELGEAADGVRIKKMRDRLWALENELLGEERINVEFLPFVAVGGERIEVAEYIHKILYTELPPIKLPPIKKSDDWRDDLADISGDISDTFRTFSDIVAASAKNTYDRELALTNKILAEEEKRLLASAKTERAKEAIRAEYAQKREQAETDATRNARSRTRAWFVADKVAAVAVGGINTTLAVLNALATTKPAALAPFVATAIGIRGAAEVAKIVRTPIPAFRTGGLVRGGEQVVRVNEAGQEFVVNASATRQNLPILQRLNDGQNVVDLSTVEALLSRILQQIPTTVTAKIPETETAAIVARGAAILKNREL